MMSALEVMNSLDSMLADVKQKYEEEIKTLKDQLLASEIEKELHRNRAAVAVRERDQYMRLATKLVAQFGTVEAVFAEAKALALAHSAAEDHTDQQQPQEPEQKQIADHSTIETPNPEAIFPQEPEPPHAA